MHFLKFREGILGEGGLNSDGPFYEIAFFQSFLSKKHEKCSICPNSLKITTKSFGLLKLESPMSKIAPSSGQNFKKKTVNSIKLILNLFLPHKWIGNELDECL